MALIIYSDPHIGVKRSAHATPSSSLKLQREIIKKLDSFLPEEMELDNYYLCCGDVFDQYSNSENVIEQGLNIMSRTDLALAGNHDIVADVDKLGSLKFIKDTTHNSQDIIFADFNQPCAIVQEMQGVIVTAVPHVTTQALFEQSLDSAVAKAQVAMAEAENHVYGSILLLHCNYASPHDLTDTSLNLTPEMADKLLETFNFIFLGHEHQPRELHDGRVVILGNVHPLGFADISDKRIISLSPEGQGLGYSSFKIWDKATGYVELDAATMDPALVNMTVQFIRVKGVVSSAELAGVSKKINSIWKSSPELLALMSEVSITKTEEIENTAAEATAETLPALISRELEADPAMKAMWEEFTQ